MCLENIFLQAINSVTCGFDLGVVRLLLLAFFLELHKFVLLVEYRLNSLFVYHFRDGFLSLVRIDAEEVSEFFEGDIHINATEHDNVVLDQCPLKNSVAICALDVLMPLKTTLEVFHVLLSNDLTVEELVQQLVECQSLDTLLLDEKTHQSCLAWTSW